MELQRHRFGRRAETLPEDQMLLGLEDVEQSLAGDDAAKPMTPAERSARAERRRSNRGCLPAHLPRVEMIVDIDDKTCPCCQRELHCIGEDRSERLDTVPAQLRVLVTVRPKYACRKCEDGVLQAAAPARLIDGGLPTEATVAQVLVSKYADHLPLYRQAQIYARQGINLDRSTLADWSCRLAPAPTARTPARKAKAKAEAVCRRDDGAGAGSRPRPHENRPILGLRRRRQAMGRNRSAGCCLFLRSRPHGGTSDESSRGLHGNPAGRRLFRLP
jgi:transposase